MSTTTINGITYLNSTDAAAIDKDLMGTLHYSIDQLMELAGLSVAQSIYDCYHTTHIYSNILIVVGPGNNGGDGLVAARHLYLFGFTHITILYPTLEKSTQKDLYKRLVKQCKTIGINITDDTTILQNVKYELIVDAIFGFSYRGTDGLRAPFDTVIKLLVQQQQHGSHIVSIDVVSGYDVNEGDINHIGLRADCLISLTAPKLCSKDYKGIHYVGGRFIWKEFGEKYKIHPLPYVGNQEYVRIN